MKSIKRGMSRNIAQVSIEYIMILGFVTFVVISLLAVAVFYTSSIKDRIRTTHINNYANKIISTAEYIFYSGEPSKATISCYLPENINQINITSNNLVIEFSTSSGINKIAYNSNVPIEENLTAPLAESQGIKNIQIIAQTDKVIVSQV
jgi:hypothetical protein